MKFIIALFSVFFVFTSIAHAEKTERLLALEANYFAARYINNVGTFVSWEYGNNKGSVVLNRIEGHCRFFVMNKRGANFSEHEVKICKTGDDMFVFNDQYKAEIHNISYQYEERSMCKIMESYTKLLDQPDFFHKSIVCGVTYNSWKVEN